MYDYITLVSTLSANTQTKFKLGTRLQVVVIQGIKLLIARLIVSWSILPLSESSLVF